MNKNPNSEKNINVFAISGSTRKNSSNDKLLQFIANKFPSIAFEIFNDLDKLPHFVPDFSSENTPEIIVDLRDKIANSHGVIICTPEYVFSLPGSLKNAIDWMVSTTVFSDKPVVQIVASASGQKAFEELHLILSTLQAKVSDETRLLIQGIKGKFNEEGRLNQEVSESIVKVVDNLLLQMN